jgi:hypothetical protein
LEDAQNIAKSGASVNGGVEEKRRRTLTGGRPFW